MTAAWMLLALVMGACVALQGTINAALSERIGTGETLLVNTAIVAVGSIVVFLVLSEPSKLSASHLLKAPWYEYFGGLCGFMIIFLAIVLFPRLGAGLTLSLAIAAQLILAVLIDHFGLMGITQHAASLPRLAGVALLIAGATLVKLY